MVDWSMDLRLLIKDPVGYSVYLLFHLWYCIVLLLPTCRPTSCFTSSMRWDSSSSCSKYLIEVMTRMIDLLNDVRCWPNRPHPYYHWLNCLFSHPSSVQWLLFFVFLSLWFLWDTLMRLSIIISKDLHILHLNDWLIDWSCTFCRRYGGSIWDSKERCGSGLNGSDETWVGYEIYCPSCHGWCAWYLWSDYCCDYQHRY